MKRTALFGLCAFACLIASTITFAQLKAQSQTGKPAAKKAEASETCPFSIVGMWKPEALTEADPYLLSFSREGLVTVFTRTEEVNSPQDFEMVDAVKYRLDSKSSPKRLEFTVGRGNDVFPPGTTTLLIADHDDESFTAKDLQSGLRKRWVRVQTHRYFLTFAGRRSDSDQGDVAFAMWIRLDGRKTEFESIGVFPAKDDAGKTVATFGEVPSGVSADFESDKRKDSEPMLRIELGEAEYERSHKVFDTWQKGIQKQRLPYEDPHQNVVELFKNATESISSCRKEMKLHALDKPALDDLARSALSQRPLEYIRTLRKKNVEIHLPDAAYPWIWRPALPQ